MSDDRGSKDNSSPTPTRASLAPGAKPRSIQPPAQAHEEDDWDADEATTIFNPKAMLEAARNATKSQTKEQAATATPVQSTLSATSNESAAIDASPSSPISSRANATLGAHTAPSPSKTPAPAASAETPREPSQANVPLGAHAAPSPSKAPARAVPVETTREASAVSAETTREASAVPAETTRETAAPSDAIAAVRTHRVGSHTEKTTPSTRAFAAVQRAAAPRADQYVWLAAGALVFVAGAWFALRSGGDSASRSRPVAHTEQVSSESSTSSLAAAPPPSSSVQAAARAIEAQRLPRTNHVAAASEQKPSSDVMTSVTVTVLPAQARFYYQGKPVGHSPMRVELKPGEHRSFELGCPGYQTRKVTVDGTRTSMRVTMTPEAAQARGSDPTVDPGQAQSGQAQSGQAQSGQAQSGQAQSGQAQSGQAQ